MYSEFMLEWKVFDGAMFKESNTLITNNLKQIITFINENILSLKNNDFSIKGLINGKWEKLV